MLISLFINLKYKTYITNNQNLSHKTFILDFMKSFESKVLKILILFTTFVIFYHTIFLIFTPFITQQESLNDFKFLSFTITFFGLHTFFALSTFISTRLPLDSMLSFFLLQTSILTPAVYLILNKNYLMNLNVSSFVVVLFSVIIFDFLRKDTEKNKVRKYIRVLINPFYLDSEDMQF